MEGCSTTIRLLPYTFIMFAKSLESRPDVLRLRIHIIHPTGTLTAHGFDLPTSALVLKEMKWNLESEIDSYPASLGRGYS